MKRDQHYFYNLPNQSQQLITPSEVFAYVRQNRESYFSKMLKGTMDVSNYTRKESK